MTQKRTSSTVLYPYASVTVTLFTQEKISVEDARAVHKTLTEIADHNILNGKDDATKARYEKAKTSVDKRFDQIALQIYDCAYFQAKLKPEYDADPDNYEVYQPVYQQLKQAGCEDADPLMVELRTKIEAYVDEYNARMAVERWNALPNSNKGAVKFKEEAYEEGIGYYEAAIEEATEDDKKADYHYAIAQGYFKLKSYSKARSHARSAANLKSGWGEPYLLIGSLYASSTRTCGSGSEEDKAFEGRMVVLAAIAKYAQAKRVDSSVAAEANKRISRISSSKPTREQVFQRGLKDGQSYKVGCWIQETVTISTVKGY